MNEKSFSIIPKTVMILIYVLFLYSCGEDSVNAPQDFVSGTITYLDTNVTITGGLNFMGSTH